MSRRHLVLGSLATASLLTAILGVAAPAAAASTIDYVALGDSYSSGVGTSGQTGSCSRSPNGYPGQWVAKNAPKSFTDLTCSGAVTGDVLATQAPAIPSGTDLVSITIGGNDAGFAPIVLTCQFASDATCAATVQDAIDDISATLPAKLDAVYAAIKAKAPGAQVVVLDYPLLFDTSSSSCGIAGMSLAKRKVLNQGAGVLDDLTRARVAAAGLTWSDVRDEFAGHGICASSAWLNGLTVIPAQNSFHPNKAGYTNGYLPAFSGAIA